MINNPLDTTVTPSAPKCSHGPVFPWHANCSRRRVTWNNWFVKQIFCQCTRTQNMNEKIHVSVCEAMRQLCTHAVPGFCPSSPHSNTEAADVDPSSLHMLGKPSWNHCRHTMKTVASSNFNGMSPYQLPFTLHKCDKACTISHGQWGKKNAGKNIKRKRKNPEMIKNKQVEEKMLYKAGPKTKSMLQYYVFHAVPCAQPNPRKLRVVVEGGGEVGRQCSYIRKSKIHKQNQWNYIKEVNLLAIYRISTMVTTNYTCTPCLLSMKWVQC